MHTCPICDEVCDCDMDDTWGLNVPADCPHICEDDDDEWDEPESDSVCRFHGEQMEWVEDENYPNGGFWDCRECDAEEEAAFRGGDE